MSRNLRCEEARLGLPGLAEGGDDAGPVDAALVRHVASCPACEKELLAVRKVIDVAGSLARGIVPEPPEDYWESFLPSVRARIVGREGVRQGALPAVPSLRPLGRAAVAAAAGLMIASAAALLLAPPCRPGELARLRQAGERMEQAMSPDPRLSGETAAELLGIDPMPGIGAGDFLEALREIGPPPALTGTWSGVEDGEVERSIDHLDNERARQLVTELAAARG